MAKVNKDELIDGIAQDYVDNSGDTATITFGNLRPKLDTAVYPKGTLEITSNGQHNVRTYENVDVEVPQPTGTISISSNDTYDVSQYASAAVDVHGIGTLSITENGEYNVDGYATAEVDVASGLSLLSDLTLNQDGTYTVTDEDGTTHTMVVQATDGQITSATRDGKSVPLSFDTNGNLESVGTTDIDVSRYSGTILSGTDTPTSALGNNGDIYLQYGAYKFLDYIEASGNQSIDTGIDITPYSYFELKAAFTQNQSNNCVYGLGYPNKESNVISTGGRIYNQIGGINISISHDTNAHIFKADVGNIYIDNSSGNANWSNVPTGERIRLFAVAYNGTFDSSRVSYSRIYYCKMYNGNTLIRDFAPVKTADNKLGMLDKVNGVFYENDGSGFFTEGSVIQAGDGIIYNSFVKKNGVWISLIGADINDVSI